MQATVANGSGRPLWVLTLCRVRKTFNVWNTAVDEVMLSHCKRDVTLFWWKGAAAEICHVFPPAEGCESG